MKKIRVGFDVSPLYSGHQVRGIGFYTRHLLAELKKLEHLAVVELKTKAEIEKAGYDLLHIPYFHPYFLTLPWRKRKPLLVTVHDLFPVKYPRHYPPGVKGWWRWQWQKRRLGRAEGVVTDSLASKRDISRLAGYRQRIEVVSLAAGNDFGVVKDKNRLAKVRKKYRLPDRFVLYVGDVNWNKNVPGLVKACKRTKIPLVIVGKQAAENDFDPCHPENKDLAWLRNKVDGERLIAPGFVKTKDLVAIYNLAILYCQPSFDEGFGLPVLEAMKCGCPVVSSNRGSLPEVVGNAGVLVGPSVGRLSLAIGRLLGDFFLRKKLSRAGLKRAKEFSWRKTARKTLAVYRAVLQT